VCLFVSNGKRFAGRRFRKRREGLGARHSQTNERSAFSRCLLQIYPAICGAFRAVLCAEVARGEPTAVVLATKDAALGAELQEEFAAPNFRVYTNDDVLGVELAGAMKT